ncbi:MAG TPA: BON domain-containing protein [Chitinophagaceae bacterium]|nr:BON domain-containing protein [Chitinophagaceae bacterium]
MNKRINQLLAIPLMVLFLIVSVTACKQKTSDADLKTAVDKAIAANSSLSGAYTDVKDGVVTLTGEVKDDAAKTSAEEAAKGVNGVKSVVNNLTVTPPPAAPVVITADDPLKASVDAAIKNYPGVSATIKDGVVTLTGEIKKANLQKLMMALHALKPKSIDNTQLTIK